MSAETQSLFFATNLSWLRCRTLTCACGSGWMSTKHKAVVCLVLTLVLFDAIRVFERLGKESPVHLVFRDAVSKVSEDLLVVYLGLAICMSMVRF